MAQLLIAIPDAQLTRVVAGFANAYGYSTTLPDGSPNPETRREFMERQVREFIKITVRSAEVNAASETARIAEMGKTPVDIT